MTDKQFWAALPDSPGLCRWCQYPFLNQTNRGTTYLRCTRATWDERLTKYPRLPVQECVGYEPVPEVPT